MSKISKILILVLIIGGMVFGFGLNKGTAQSEPPFPIIEKPFPKALSSRYVSDEIIVKFKPGVSAERISEIYQKEKIPEEKYISPFVGFRVLKIPAGKTVEEMVNIFQKNPLVEYTEPNSICYAFMIPADEHYPWQWNFDDDNTINTGGASSNPYGGANGGGIRMEEAWDIDTTAPLYGGDPNVVVAVLDTGIAYENYKGFCRSPDFAGSYPGFTAGYDFANSDIHPNDDEGHGTHVAGTITSSTNNDYVAGIAFNSTLMPVKVLNRKGEGTADWVADGIYYAVNNGADIINMSLGWPPGYDPGETVYNAIKYAYDHGVVQIAATGNESASQISYPAKYSEVIAVGATRYDETRASYSNYGEGIDLVAPGGDLGVDQNEDGYGDGVCQITFSGGACSWYYVWADGTSMSTPHVSGVVALLLAQDSNRTPDDIRNILQSTAEDKGTTGWDQYYGHGIVDAYAALTYAPAVSISLTTDGLVEFGTLPLEATADSSEDVQTVSINIGPANLDVRSTVFSDNGNSWSLGTTNGDNQVVWEYSEDGSIWTIFEAPDTLYDLADNVAQGNTQNLYLQITMPTETSSSNQYSSVVTIVATEP
ncbi:peptidase S8 [Patescibacteria group bacterium]|nr:peptidase S8 [Patescibacteria group bacterium]